MRTRSVPADDSVPCVSVPRAVLGERFYRSRSGHKQGRRQEPCSTPNDLPRFVNRPRFPGAVLLRSAIQNDTQQKSFLGFSNHDTALEWISHNGGHMPAINEQTLQLLGNVRCILVNVHEYRTILLRGGMVAGYAAKEFVEIGLKAGELGIVSADNALPCERPRCLRAFFPAKRTKRVC
jgi:hypothetical protein